MKRIFRPLIAFAACMVCLASCIDEEYDLNKDINQEITVGGAYLSLPIGTTDSIVLSELFDFDDDDEFFKALENGNYSISYKDTADIDSIKIGGVIIPETKASIESSVTEDIKFLSAPSGLPYLTRSRVVVPFSIGDRTDSISISNYVPDEIEKLFLVEMKEPGVLDISTKFTLPIGIDTVILKGFTITFPEMFVFEKQSGDDRSVSDTVIRKNGEFLFEEKRYLKSFNFGDNNPIIDGTTKQFKLNEEIEIIGEILAIVYPDSLLDQTSIKLTMTSSVVLREMTFSKVTGIFNPKVDAINEVFEFDGLPEFLQGDNVTLDFINPTIKFEVSNSLDIPMNANATITPMIDGKLEEGVDATLNIKGSKDPKAPETSKFWLSKIADADATLNGWEHKDEDIGLLFKRMPDSLSIIVDVEVDKESENHTIDLTETYSLKVNYEVDVPLALGADFKINYSDTIKDIGEDLEDVIDKITSLSLGLDATNSVPLNMSVRLIPVDKDFKKIEGLGEVEAVKISAGTKDESALDGSGTKPTMTEDLSFKLTETKAGALAKIFHFILAIEADVDNSTVGGVTLNANQYIYMELSAKIEGGITIDLDE